MDAEWMARRRQKVLSGLDLKMTVGVEIGPLNNPIVSREAAGEIYYVDHADTAFLRNKYAKDPNVDIDRIVHVDAVWGKNTLSQALGEERQVDYIIASHVIEHVPDLVSWLGELSAVLKPGGSVRLAVPDKRFTFDLLRRETELAEVLNAYLVKTRTPLPFSILDFRLNWRQVDTVAAWEGKIDRASLKGKFTIEESFATAQDALTNGTYWDVHCWVFTPKSLARLFEQLAVAGMINFACEQFFDTPQHELEFILTLGKCQDQQKMIASWRHMYESAADHIKGSQLDAALRELASTRQELEQAKQRIDNLEDSTSWKVTRPLRSVMGTLRGE